MNETKQSLGGKATAKKLRTLALIKYYEDPTICQYCGSIIIVKDDEKVADVKKRKYCSQVCNGNAKKIKDQYLHIEKKSERSKRRKGVMSVEEYNRNRSILFKTKGELFSNRANWQSARSSIQRLARENYFNHFNSRTCCRTGCTYCLHIDVAHIKSVSEFEDSALISEINDASNLVGLCKNHHWEFDHGYLSINDFDLSSRQSRDRTCESTE